MFVDYEHSENEISHCTLLDDKFSSCSTAAGTEMGLFAVIFFHRKFQRNSIRFS